MLSPQKQPLIYGTYYVNTTYPLNVGQGQGKKGKNYILPGGESNPGLPRDRRGYSPLYYRGLRAKFPNSYNIHFSI